MAFWALLLGGLWISQALLFVFTGRLPVVNGSVDAFRLVATLDLSLLIPGLVLAVVWLWNRRPWGYVIAAMMNVSGGLYALVLSVGSLFADRAGVPGAGSLIPLWAALCAANLICCGFLFGNMTQDVANPLPVEAMVE